MLLIVNMRIWVAPVRYVIVVECLKIEKLWEKSRYEAIYNQREA